MDAHPILMALFGGGLIGVAAGAFLLLNGRIAGISGIAGGLMTPVRGQISWRVAMLLGLVAGGILLTVAYPQAFPENIEASTGELIVAGLLVGFGTRLGSGCTSGHGVCGVARLSPRSLVATITFISFGAVTVLIARQIGS